MYHVYIEEGKIIYADDYAAGGIDYLETEWYAIGRTCP
jgi:hypothetical protein